MTIGELSELLQDDIISILEDHVNDSRMNMVLEAIIDRINEYKSELLL